MKAYYSKIGVDISELSKKDKKELKKLVDGIDHKINKLLEGKE